MWPFTKSIQQQVSDLQMAVNQLSGRLERLGEAHEELQDAHRRLRGRVYAAGIHKVGLKDDAAAEPGQSAPSVEPKLSKEELKKRIGFVPGRPFPHKE